MHSNIQPSFEWIWNWLINKLIVCGIMFELQISLRIVVFLSNYLKSNHENEICLNFFKLSPIWNAFSIKYRNHKYTIFIFINVFSSLFSIRYIHLETLEFCRHKYFIVGFFHIKIFENNLSMHFFYHKPSRIDIVK